MIFVDSPIFAEIVPEKSRMCIYALDRSFESVLSSFAPPVVGILAQHVYCYKPVPQGTESIATDRGNASSLAKAAIRIPMALCCFIYSFLYCTYPRDRQRARMEALIESEMELIDNRTTVQVHEAGEDGLDLDDSDEKLLLYRQLTFANLGK